MKIRRVLADSSSLYAHHCWRLVPPAVVLAVLPASPILLLPPPIGEGAAALLALPIMFVLQALHVVESAEVRAGKPRPIWRSFADLRPSLKPLVLAMLFAFAKTVVYFVVFAVAEYEALVHHNVGWLIAILIGGILGFFYLLARWSLLVPVIVLEGPTVRRAFKRCGDLVGRHVFGVVTVLVIGSIVYVIVDVLALLAIHAAVQGESTRAFTEKIVSEPVSAPFLALLGTTAYFALREEREGIARRPIPALA